MKKAAVMFSGMTRYKHETTTVFCDNVLAFDEIDFDIYCHLWNIEGCRLKTEVYKTKGEEDNFAVISHVKTIDEKTEARIEGVKRDLDIKDIAVSDYKSFKDEAMMRVNAIHKRVPSRAEKSILNIISQYYKVSQCFKMIPNPGEYDVLIRARFDWKPLVKVNWEKILTDIDKHLYFPKQNARGWRKIDDTFAAGIPSHMGVYCTLYDYLDDYLDEAEETEQFNSETLMVAHLCRFGIEAKDIDLPYELVKRSQKGEKNGSRTRHDL